MRAMVLGASGMLGRDIMKEGPSAWQLCGFSHAELDVTDRPSVAKALGTVRPEVVINAAAYTKVDQAESETELAYSINATAVATLATMAAEKGFLLVHIGTDYVFDGDSNSPYPEEGKTNPLGTYGSSKLAGERALEDSGAAYLLVRTQWLFGIHGRSFPKTMWERAKRGAATAVVNDQTGRPTHTVDVARAIWTLVLGGWKGCFHVANSGEATWFDVAAHIFKRAQKSSLLKACTTKDYPTIARRPYYSVLSTQHYDSSTHQPLRNWRTALDDFLTALDQGVS